MNPQFSQPGGSVSKDVNKQSIARVYGVKMSEVAYLKAGLLLDSYKVLYDKTTQTCWQRGNATGTTITWQVSGSSLNLVTTAGSFELRLLNILANLDSDEGADLVVSKKPYTGTVRRKVSEMLAETISPWDFGCVSDAVFDPTTQRLIDGTDNTSNLQRMLAEAHYHGVPIDLPLNGRFASKSLYLHYDAVKTRTGLAAQVA